MDSHIAQPNYSEGVEEEHHEKKSMLTKVKAKARKIKHTLTKHGHGNNGDDHVPDDHEFDEENDYEFQDSPDIHGSGDNGEDHVPDVHDLDKEDDYELQKDSPRLDKSINVSRPESGNMPPGLNYERPTPMSVDPPATEERHTGTGIGKTNDVLSGEGPPNTPVVMNPGSHDTGETDPPATEERHTGTGIGKTSDVLSGEGLHNTPVVMNPGSHGTEEDGQPGVNLGTPGVLEEDPHGANAHAPPPNYQTKVSDPTGQGGREADVTPMIHSFDRMNISPESETKEAKTGTKPNLSGTELDKTGSSKVRDVSTGTHNQLSPEPMPPTPISTTEKSQTLDTTEDQNEQRDQTHETANQSSYTDKISFASSALAEKAVAAKNVVASTLGYGEKEKGLAGLAATESHEGETNTNDARSSLPVEYGKKIASSVTDTLAPVYGKVAGAGTTVFSKIQGTSTATPSPSSGVDDKGVTVKESGVDGVADKGVSYKAYVAEKLKPGEEDRALSGVISDALFKRKEDVGTDSPVGKVTESEQVARELGSEEPISSPVKSTMVDKLRGVVGSYFGKEESQPQDMSATSTNGTEEADSNLPSEGYGNVIQAGETRLQESTN